MLSAECRVLSAGATAASRFGSSSVRNSARACHAVVTRFVPSWLRDSPFNRMRVVVYGLWHLGCVTATCLAGAGNDVVGLDHDGPVVDDLRRARPPLEEPHLADMMAGE